MRRQLVVCFISRSTHKQRRHEPSVNLGPGVEVIPMLHLIARAILDAMSWSGLVETCVQLESGTPGTPGYTNNRLLAELLVTVPRCTLVPTGVPSVSASPKPGVAGAIPAGPVKKPHHLCGAALFTPARC